MAYAIDVQISKGNLPKFRACEVCFMLAPPPADFDAPVASSNPPSPFGPEGRDPSNKCNTRTTFHCKDSG